MTRGIEIWGRYFWKRILPPNRYLSTKVSHIAVGDSATMTKKITSLDVQKFTELSGDSNPVHTSQHQQRAIVHGAYLNSLVSCLMGTQLPGAGSLVVKQTLNFPSKCFVDDVVVVTIRILEVRKIIKVSFQCVVESEEKTVLYGDAHLVTDRYFQ